MGDDHADRMFDPKEIFYKETGGPMVPSRGSKGAAGWDLYASKETELIAYQPTLVPTDLEIAIPKGHMLLVLPRSGNSLKKQIIIPNSPGLIDSDYRGHLQVILTWIPFVGHYENGTGLKDEYGRDQQMIITKGDRIAQAVLVPYVEQIWTPVKKLPKTERGSGGFGSTGV